MRELGFIDEMKNEIWKMKLYWSMILFSPGKLLASTMRSPKTNLTEVSCKFYHKDRTGDSVQQATASKVPFVKRTMTLKNVQHFRLKVLKT